MSATNTLKQIAQQLPTKQRERFLLMCTRFQNVPEDDEYLQMLEAIGLMTLLWREVPAQIEKILEQAAPVEPNHQRLEKFVREAVTQSIPSYDDLKRLSERLSNHETTLKRLLSANHTNKATTHKRSFGWLWFFIGFASNTGLAYLLQKLL